MKLLYPLIFGILGAVAGLAALFVWGMLLAAIMFIIFGDRQWPRWFDLFAGEKFFLFAGLILLTAGFIIGAFLGKKLYLAKKANLDK